MAQTIGLLRFLSDTIDSESIMPEAIMPGRFPYQIEIAPPSGGAITVFSGFISRSYLNTILLASVSSTLNE